MPTVANGVWVRRKLGLIGAAVILGGLFGLSAQVVQATDKSGQTINPAIAVASAGKADATQPALTISAVLPRPVESRCCPSWRPRSVRLSNALLRPHRTPDDRLHSHPADNLTPIAFPKNEKKWIRVDLSEQIAVAYEGSRPIRAFVVSSGLPGTPTVTGEFRIRTKVKAQTMTGGEGAGYYNLPNVKWVQYFYQEYSFHGTYWHNDFGRPKSHGCLNMTNSDAKWLFDWAGPTWDGKTVWFNSDEENPGTLVIVQSSRKSRDQVSARDLVSFYPAPVSATATARCTRGSRGSQAWAGDSRRTARPTGRRELVGGTIVRSRGVQIEVKCAAPSGVRSWLSRVRKSLPGRICTMAGRDVT